MNILRFIFSPAFRHRSAFEHTVTSIKCYYLNTDSYISQLTSNLEYMKDEDDPNLIFKYCLDKICNSSSFRGNYVNTSTIENFIKKWTELRWSFKCDEFLIYQMQMLMFHDNLRIIKILVECGIITPEIDKNNEDMEQGIGYIHQRTFPTFMKYAEHHQRISIMEYLKEKGF